MSMGWRGKANVPLPPNYVVDMQQAIVDFTPEDQVAAVLF